MATIENTSPATVVITNIVSGYTVASVSNNIGIDADIAGRVVRLGGTYHSTHQGDSPNTILSGLSSNTTYSAEVGRFDSMSNQQLIESGFNINFSPPTSIITHKYPSVISHAVTGEFVEVGSAPPALNLVLDGYADTLEVEYAVPGSNTWSTGWSGPFANELTILGLPVGVWDLRIRGVVNLTTFSEKSGWVGLAGVALANEYSTPSEPTGLTALVSKLAEPTERYDVELSWDWDRATGPEIRSFVLERLDTVRYPNTPDWDNAEKINTGTATTYTIVGHPFEREFRYRVTAVSWGPDATNNATGLEIVVRIDENTPTVDLIRRSNIEVNYAHIKASKLILGGGYAYRRQTFLLDAETGSLAIGVLDDNGVAPISVNGSTGDINVDGTIITNKIVSASFVLANVTGADNPEFYSAAKTSYADASEGIYMGHDDTNKFKFDLGNSTKYIRWDGANLRISGKVLIGDGSNSLDSFGASPTTAYYEVASEDEIPTTNALKSADYRDKTGIDPLLGSILIYLKNDTVNGGFSKHFKYDGATWSSFTVIIDGSLLASGTVAADRLVANSITGNHISSTITMKVGSGNSSTTISSDGGYRLWAGNDSAASAPFRVTSAGVLELNATKTNSALVIKNNVIKVYDAAGTLRVQLGDLSA